MFLPEVGPAPSQPNPTARTAHARAGPMAMNWRKALVWTAGVVALVAVAAAIALQARVNPERLKKEVRDKARAAFARELLVGDLSLRLWPVPYLHATRVALANPAWARDPHLLEADEVSADLELWPLLTGKVRIRTLDLRGVKAALEEGDDGSLSWELRKRAGKDAAPEPPGSADVEIAELRLRNVRIHHRAKKEDAEPLLIDEAHLQLLPGPRDVRIEAKLRRHGQPLAIRAEFADLSKLGAPGATTDGKLELDWGRTKLTASGVLPLEKSLRGQAFRGELRSESFNDLLAFFDFKREPTAPLHVKFEGHEREGLVHVDKLVASLGALQVNGEARIRLAGDKPTFEARLEADRLDWLKTLAAAGGTIKPPRKDEEVFHQDPVAWRAISLLGALEGTADLRVKSLRLGNGLELRNARARATFNAGRVALDPFSAEALGGSAKGSFRFDGGKRTMQVNLDGSNLMLQQWFEQRGSKVPFRGGPMKLNAALALKGDTFRELAASVSGRVDLRMGRGTWDSKRAGEIEEMMVAALAPKGADDLTLECAAAALRFRDGRAQGRSLVGARSESSMLLTSGHVDLRQETIDLRGRVRARSGPSLGLSQFASGVQVTGRLARPKMRLDPDDKPAVIAKAGAAIATAGATLLGGALIDAAEPKNDPCEAPFK